MRLTLAHRERRVLLAGATLIFGLLAVPRGVPAWLRWHDDARTSAAEMTAEVKRARESVQALPMVRDTLQPRGERLVALGPTLLGGETPPVAAGALAALLSDAAAEAKMRLNSVQVRTDTASATFFSRVSVRATLTGDIRGVTELLFALERGPKLLVVREISIVQPEPAGPSDRPEALRVELVVEGLALPEAAQ